MGGAGRQGGLDLGQGLDLDLHRQPPRQGAGGVQGSGDGTGRQDVILLDQDGVVEAQPMVVTAPATHGVLLRQTQARDGLAGIKQAHRQVGDHLGITVCPGSGAGEGLQEVHGGALPGEEGAGRPLDHAKAIARPNPIPIGDLPGNDDPWIDLAKALLEPGAATDDRLLAGDQFHPRYLIRRQEGGGAIAIPQILGQGDPHLPGDESRIRWLRGPARSIPTSDAGRGTR